MGIHINSLTKIYNNKKVLDIPKLSISDSEIFGVVGNNGAGKTTMFRLILDLIEADSGEVNIQNFIVNKTEKWKEFTASYLDERFLINFLTPEEYFYFVGDLYKIPTQKIDNELLGFDFFFNNEVLKQNNKYIRDFSRGNKQKIGIVSTLITNPKVIILDEPFNGLDPTSQILLKNIIMDYNKKYNTTILISSHDLNYITETCTRIVLIEKGKIIKDIINDENALNELKEYFSKSLFDKK